MRRVLSKGVGARGGLSRSVLLSLAAALACVALTLSHPASAQPPPAASYPDFAFGAPTGEALLAVGSVLSMSAMLLPQRATSWGPDSARAHDGTIDRVSDFTGAYVGSVLALGAGYELEAAYFGDQGVRGSGVYALRQPLVDLEAATLTTGMVFLLKRLTGRCRPRSYLDGTCAPQSLRDAFPSGHTAPLSAMAGARLLLATRTEGAAEVRWGAFGLTEVMALTTAVLRVRAGMHSWSDVLGGVALGHAVGLLVAAAHPMRAVDVRDRATAGGATGSGGFELTWSGEF